MITEKEKIIIKKILYRLGDTDSINSLAKKCKISPNGTIKILKKFEKEGILKMKKIVNISSYSLDFNNPKTESICKLAIIEEPSDKIKPRTEDLKNLKNITEIGIIFGSYLTPKQNPNDLDIFFLLKDKNFKKYKEEIKKIYPAMPLKVQDVLQTEKDLIKNIQEKNSVIKEILQKGFIMWGHEKLISILKNEYSG